MSSDSLESSESLGRYMAPELFDSKGKITEKALCRELDLGILDAWKRTDVPKLIWVLLHRRDMKWYYMLYWSLLYMTLNDIECILMIAIENEYWYRMI